MVLDGALEQGCRFSNRIFVVSRHSLGRHEYLISLMEEGDLDWVTIDAWLRDNVEES